MFLETYQNANDSLIYWLEKCLFIPQQRFDIAFENYIIVMIRNVL